MLKDKAVLMRLSMGLPGEVRQDADFTTTIIREHQLGASSGKFMKNLFPPEALAEIKKLGGEAQAYHDEVTLPWDRGVGILPGDLIPEYGEKMRVFSERFNALAAKFFNAPLAYVQWAKEQHNGTFNPENYPGCTVNAAGEVELDEAAFQEGLKGKFRFKTVPLPVPDSSHFETELSKLLGADADSVNARVADAVTEARREVMRRLIEPVQAMAQKLVEAPKQRKDGTMAEDIVFRDSLIGNIKDIAELAPKLNISGDPVIDQFARDCESLTRYAPDTLRHDKTTRSEAAAKARALMEKMAGYKF